MRLRQLLTTRGRAFVGAGAVLVASGVVFGFRDLTRFGTLLLLLPFAAALLVRSRKARMRITRTVEPARPSVGQDAVVALQLQNRGSTRSPALLAEERIDYTLGDRPRFVIEAMPPEGSRTVSYPVRTQTRGRHRLGPLGVAIDDPFGLAHRAAVLQGQSEFLVLPRIHRLGPGLSLGSGVGTEGDQAHLLALHGDDDVTVRDYRDGDDLRRIHWPSTARTGELMVRQEDRPAQRRAVLVLDPRPEGHAGHGPAGSFEWAVSALASMAVHLCEHGFAVHLVCSETVADGRAAEALGPQELLSLLAVAEMRPRSADDEILHASQALTQAGGLVVAVATPSDLEVTRRLTSLKSSGTTAMCALIDTAGFGGARHAQPVEPHELAYRGAGWRVVTVRRATGVAQAWERLNAATAGAAR